MLLVRILGKVSLHARVWPTLHVPWISGGSNGQLRTKGDTGGVLCRQCLRLGQLQLISLRCLSEPPDNVHYCRQRCCQCKHQRLFASCAGKWEPATGVATCSVMQLPCLVMMMMMVEQVHAINVDNFSRSALAVHGGCGEAGVPSIQ